MKKYNSTTLFRCFSALLVGALGAGVVFAQSTTSDKAPTPRVQVPARTLASHVFRKIDPALDQIYIVNTFNLKDGAQKDLPYSWARNQPFYNDVWYFDFEIKSLRTIVLPSAIMVDGQRKPVLKKYMYLMYRIKNPARYFTVKQVQTVDGVENLKGRQEEVFGRYVEDLTALQEVISNLPITGMETPKAEMLGAIEPMPMSFEFITQKDRELEFTPVFELQMDDEQWSDHENRKMMLRRRKMADEYNPFVVKKIAEKERVPGKLYGSCDFIGKKIKPGEEVWGVAVWSDINYTADRFSIVINGLTNVRKYEPEEGKYFYKNLKLNYWHPGELDIFRFGQPGGLDFEWIFE